MTIATRPTSRKDRIISRAFDAGTASLEAVYATQYASACDDAHYVTAFRAGDRCLVRCIVGMEETVVASLRFERRQALLLEPDAHADLVDILVDLGWSLHQVDGLVDPICPSCGGDGEQTVESGYTIYGSGYGDCLPREFQRTCPTCSGSGRL